MPFIPPTNPCQQSEIDPVKLVDPINLNNLNVLLQTILHGEGLDDDLEWIFETKEQWIKRIESYAYQLSQSIFGSVGSDWDPSEAGDCISQADVRRERDAEIDYRGHSDITLPDDDGMHDLCEDEGCPHHGTKHVCVTRVETAEEHAVRVASEDPGKGL